MDWFPKHHTKKLMSINPFIFYKNDRNQSKTYLSQTNIPVMTMVSLKKATKWHNDRLIRRQSVCENQSSGANPTSQQTRWLEKLLSWNKSA